jgi:hypothetical protein
MKRQLLQYRAFFLLCAGIFTIFLMRTLLAKTYPVPRLNDIFSILTSAGALVVLLRGFRCLRWGDWLSALLCGAVVGVGMIFATNFSPYPFLGIVGSSQGQGVVRGLFTTLAVLGGLVIARQGGPVQLHAAGGAFKQTWRGILVGLAVGLPLAVLNVFALQITQGQAIAWQSPLPALLDALQPGLVEEAIYRFALWGLLWLALRKTLPAQAAWLAGGLAMLVHNYAHFDDLFLQSPLTALGMGAVMALFWGLPPLLLARRQGLESAAAFHWLQDAARFAAGF